KCDGTACNERDQRERDRELCRIEDLTSAGLFIDSRTFRSFEVFLTLTVLYVLMALGFKALLALAERSLFQWRHVR
ncbi:MAG: hypothetical protein AAGJ53_08390, partial [Pseudomonadota bacterium]